MRIFYVLSIRRLLIFIGNNTQTYIQTHISSHIFCVLSIHHLLIFIGNKSQTQTQSWTQTQTQPLIHFVHHLTILFILLSSSHTLSPPPPPPLSPTLSLNSRPYYSLCALVLLSDNLVTDRFVIGASYLKSWFWLDLVSSIPFDQITVTSGSGTGAVRVVRVLRLLRLTRLFKLARWLFCPLIPTFAIMPPSLLLSTLSQPSYCYLPCHIPLPPTHPLTTLVLLLNLLSLRYLLSPDCCNFND